MAATKIIATHDLEILADEALMRENGLETQTLVKSRLRGDGCR